MRKNVKILVRIWILLSVLSTIMSWADIPEQWVKWSALLTDVHTYIDQGVIRSFMLGFGVLSLLGIFVVYVIDRKTALLKQTRLTAKEWQAGEEIARQIITPAYEAWDEVEELELFQAACLWAEIEPALPVSSGEPYARLRMLKEAIRKRELYPFGNLREALNLRAGRYTPNVHTVVTRKSLRDFAEKRGHRPLFLFPEERHTTASKGALISARGSRRAMISGNVVYGNRPLLDADGSDDLTAERNLGVEPSSQEPNSGTDTEGAVEDRNNPKLNRRD